jgi:Putative Flp pilus-assembly TadE/G-like
MSSRASKSHRNLGERGQIVVIFAGAIIAFVALSAIVIDVSWYWSNSLRMQRAADAAALAGVVFLPGDPNLAISTARLEATKNGYTDGSNGVSVTPSVDPQNSRRIRVTVSGPVNTYFARVVGLTQLNASRQSKADFVLPVPMGSPQNYYGVGVFHENVDHSDTQPGPLLDTGYRVPSGTAPTGGAWTFLSGGSPARNITNVVATEDNNYAWATNGAQAQQWTNFGLQGQITNPGSNQSLVIRGIEVVLSDAFLSAACSSSKLSAELSWNGGSAWTPIVGATQTPNLGTTATSDYTLSAANSVSDWGSHAWAYGDFTDANFRVRLTSVKGCATAGIKFNVDQLQVRVTYVIYTTTITTTIDVVDIKGPHNETLVPQNFWASVGSQGWPTTRGDAYLSSYLARPTTPGTSSSPGGTPNTQFAPSTYYNYAVELPSGGDIYIFDPGFCNQASGLGTSETWVSTGTNGPPDPNSRRPISSQYNLFKDAQRTPYNYLDDQWVTSSDDLFERSNRNDNGSAGTDSSPAPSSCAGQSGSSVWHNGWYQLASGLSSGTYRLHTTNRIYTDHSAALSSWDTSDDQVNSAGGNYFAIWTNAGGRIYGLGAMSAQFQLDPGIASKFYLAQIDATYAGKWVDIDLWDIGDGGASELQVLAPGASAYTPASFNWNVTPVAGPAMPANFTCGPTTSAATTALQVNNGSTNMGENHWIRLCLQIPTTYAALHPSSDTVTAEGGWWKIQYYPTGTATSDVTTWQVNVRGNPVHLVLP